MSYVAERSENTAGLIHTTAFSGVVSGREEVRGWMRVDLMPH